MKSVFVGAAVCALVLFAPFQAHGLQQYEYDLRGRLVTITYADGSVIEYEYDLHGNRTQRLVTLGQGGGAPSWASATVASLTENTGGTFYTAQATDPQNDPITYSIAGGGDAGVFAINGTSGALSFIAAPDFENPSDSDGNNIYSVILRASDGTDSTDHTLDVTVTNVNDVVPNWVSAASASVAENTSGTVYTAQATDPDGASLTYSIVGGLDSADFIINGTSGALRFQNAPDFESPTDSGANNVYNVTLSASDGQLSSTRALAVTVTDVSEQSNGAPSAVNDSYTAQAGSQNTYWVLANDSDPDGDTLTITSVSTPSIGFASISGAQIEYVAPFFASGFDSFTYTISDGNGGTDTATVSVTVEQSGGMPF